MFTLIDLPYSKDALEPVISARTLEFHHGKHLQAYVDNLNKLLPASGLEELPLEEIVKNSSGAIFNNAGQVLNHNLYFTQFKAPSTIQSANGVILSEADAIHNDSRVILSKAKNLSAQIVKQWGSIDAFKAAFEATGTTLFGSGWVWLQADSAGELSIAQYANADNPIAHNLKPLLTFDVWEHAYYLDYQNLRATHLQALWQTLDWNVLETRYNELRRKI